jgi:hypothetical protein
MALLPSIITHNFDPARGPFRNICNLAYEEAEHILDDIRRTGNRKYKSNYLQRRIATEEWLYAERTRKLGKPRLAHPIYFFLGEFYGTDPARPLSVRIPLTEFSRQTITFTYPDSMASLPLATLVEHQADRRPYHGQVFTLDEIESVVSEYGMPVKAIDGSGPHYDTFIEVQIWDENPLREYCQSDLEWREFVKKNDF